MSRFRYFESLKSSKRLGLSETKRHLLCLDSLRKWNVSVLSLYLVNWRLLLVISGWVTLNVVIGSARIPWLVEETNDGFESPNSSRIATVVKLSHDEVYAYSIYLLLITPLIGIFEEAGRHSYILVQNTQSFSGFVITSSAWSLN